MADTYFAFDAFTKETEAVRRNGFQIKDERFTLPADLPAKLVLRALRLSKGDVSQDQVLAFFDEFFTLMLGADGYDRLLDTGISFEGLQKLIAWIIEQYNPATAGETTRKNS